MILFAEYPYSAYVFLIARISTWVVAVILAKNNYNWGNALIVAVLYPIPLVSIVVYLSVRDETRRVLKLHGYQPGWPKYVLSEEAARRIEAGFDLNAEKKKLRRSVLDLCMTYGLILILGLMLAGVYATYP